MCDYDLCTQCAAAMEEASCTQGIDASIISKTENAITGSLSLADASDTCKAILNSAHLPAAVQALRSLCQHHGLQFSQEDVRQAALKRGSVGMLRVLLCSEPQVQLLGMDIFDRRYPGLVVSEGVKACIRMLLSRGAKLGSFAPASKLLRKVEADELEAWVQRYFISMNAACMDLPDHVRQQIWNFLK